MSFLWTDEAVGELKRLFDDGLSSSQIALGLARYGRLTRNAVIGALHRRGMKRGYPTPKLPPRPPRVQRKGVHQAKAWKPRAPTPITITTEESYVAKPCTLMDLTNETCRWPIGEGADMLFCGSPTADLHNGQPYCPMHERMAYAPRAATTRRPFVPMRGAVA